MSLLVGCNQERWDRIEGLPAVGFKQTGSYMSDQEDYKSLWISKINGGRGVVVVQGHEEYEKNEEGREFMKAIATGLMEARKGKEQGLDEVKTKPGIK